MGFKLGKGQILIDDLLHLETRLHPKRELRHHAQRAQPHHRAIKGRAELIGRHRDKLTRRCQQLKSQHRRRQTAIAIARAVRGSGTRPRHRNMRQRGYIVQSITGLV